MQFLKKTSIKGKQTLIVVLTSGAALLLACAAFATYEVMTFRATMVDNLSTLTEIIGNNSSAALDFSDPKAATETLSALRAQPNIKGACIYTSKGNVFAVYDRANDGKTFSPPLRQTNTIKFSKNSLELFRPIVRDNETLGTVYVLSDLNALYSRLDKYVLIAIAVFFASGLVALLLSSQLGRLISGPILSLVQTARAVTVEKNYSVRAVKQSEDELGVLIDAFNEMLKQIQERDADLQKSHIELEKRVAERTEEVVNSLSLVRATLESTTDGILATDESGRVTSFNEKFVEMWHIPPEVLGLKETQKMAEAVSSQLNDPEQFLLKIRLVYAEPEKESFDLIEFKDGKIFERYSKLQRVADKCVGRVWSFRDITERKKNEQQLHVQYVIGRVLAEAATVEQAAPQILQAICENLGWDAGGLWHLDPREEVLRCAEIWSMPGLDVEEFKMVSKQMTFARGTGLPGRVWSSGKPAWIHDVVHDPNFPRSPMAERAGLHGAFGFPILIENEVGAVIELFNRRPRLPDDSSLLIVATLGNQIGQFFQRKRSGAELEENRRLLKGVLGNAVDGIVAYEVIRDDQGTLMDFRFLLVNPAAERLLGQPARDLVGRALLDTSSDIVLDGLFESFVRIVDTGATLDFEYSAVRSNSMRWYRVAGVKLGDGLVMSYSDITERKRAETELEQMHKQLVDTSRQAGMAEVATSVLHNVGNVLNSVNVSSTLVSNQVRKSKVTNLAKVVALLNEHATDIGAFLTSDPKGKQLPGYLGQLAEHLVIEQNTVLKELKLLHENIEHIKDIVVMQQSYAKISGIVETVKITDLVEDALRLNLGALQRHGVEVLREFEEVPPVDVEKHKILQILVNLVRNAKYACDESLRLDKLMTLRVSRNNDQIEISVIDNGIGIPPENLTRIFNHGFTTRKDGHGFGLHSAVLAAMEMGGSLKVQSDGIDKGAAFTLELPYTPHTNLHN